MPCLFTRLSRFATSSPNCLYKWPSIWLMTSAYIPISDHLASISLHIFMLTATLTAQPRGAPNWIRTQIVVIKLKRANDAYSIINRTRRPHGALYYHKSNTWVNYCCHCQLVLATSAPELLCKRVALWELAVFKTTAQAVGSIAIAPAAGIPEHAFCNLNRFVYCVSV